MAIILNGGAPVTTYAQLNAAIAAADAEATNGGAYEIDLGNAITLSGALTAISLANGVSLDIEGRGFALDGGGAWRGLTVSSGALSLNALAINHTLAAGASNGTGAGGGPGLGGAL